MKAKQEPEYAKTWHNLANNKTIRKVSKLAARENRLERGLSVNGKKFAKSENSSKLY